MANWMSGQLESQLPKKKARSPLQCNADNKNSMMQKAKKARKQVEEILYYVDLLDKKAGKDLLETLFMLRDQIKAEYENRKLELTKQ